MIGRFNPSSRNDFSIEVTKIVLNGGKCILVNFYRGGRYKYTVTLNRFGLMAYNYEVVLTNPTLKSFSVVRI